MVLATRPRRVRIPDIRELEQRLTAVLASEMSVRRVEEILRGMPGDVVQSIIGSTSKRSGKLNELLAALELTKYDRLFYLGSPIDFVGVKYDQGGGLHRGQVRPRALHRGREEAARADRRQAGVLRAAQGGAHRHSGGGGDGGVRKGNKNG